MRGCLVVCVTNPPRFCLSPSGGGVSKLDYLHPLVFRVRCQCNVQRGHVTCTQLQSNGKMQGIPCAQPMTVQLGHFRSHLEGATADRHNTQTAIGQQPEFFAHPLCIGLADLPGAHLD